MIKKVLNIIFFSFVKFLFIFFYLFSFSFSSSKVILLNSDDISSNLLVLKEQAYYESMGNSFKKLIFSLSDFVEGGSSVISPRSSQSSFSGGILFRKNPSFFNGFKNACDYYALRDHSLQLSTKEKTDYLGINEIIWQGIFYILTDINDWIDINTINITQHIQYQSMPQTETFYDNGKKIQPLSILGLQGTIDVGKRLSEFLGTYSLVLFSFCSHESLSFPCKIEDDSTTTYITMAEQNQNLIVEVDMIFKLLVTTRPAIMTVIQQFEKALTALQPVAKLKKKKSTLFGRK